MSTLGGNNVVSTLYQRFATLFQRRAPTLYQRCAILKIRRRILFHFQRRINVISTLIHNVETTLIRHWNVGWDVIVIIITNVIVIIFIIIFVHCHASRVIVLVWSYCTTVITVPIWLSGKGKSCLVYTRPVKSEKHIMSKKIQSRLFSPVSH